MSTPEPTPDTLEQERSADPAEPETGTGIDEPARIAEHEDVASEADLIEQHQDAGADPAEEDEDRDDGEQR